MNGELGTCASLSKPASTSLSEHNDSRAVGGDEHVIAAGRRAQMRGRERHVAVARRIHVYTASLLSRAKEKDAHAVQARSLRSEQQKESIVEELNRNS
jgi:hypothetical protein